jgi:hypothetical protein
MEQELSGAEAGGIIALLGSMLLIIGAVSLILIIGIWKTFSKAGKPGWHSIIPFLNTYTLAEIAGKPGWWGIVACLVGIIPIVGAIASLVMFVMIWDGISKGFGKGTGFTVGLILLNPIFVLILAFGDAQYTGIEGQQSSAGIVDEEIQPQP